ncbi:hypothetical protein DL767_004183 [Monosporascus sp. MG133]|nr:hypothetical protein DL767_004183 [Monosporascus sp. MG133]
MNEWASRYHRTRRNVSMTQRMLRVSGSKKGAASWCVDDSGSSDATLGATSSWNRDRTHRIDGAAGVTGVSRPCLNGQEPEFPTRTSEVNGPRGVPVLSPAAARRLVVARSYATPSGLLSGRNMMLVLGAVAASSAE